MWLYFKHSDCSTNKHSHWKILLWKLFLTAKEYTEVYKPFSQDQSPLTVPVGVVCPLRSKDAYSLWGCQHCCDLNGDRGGLKYCYSGLKNIKFNTIKVLIHNIYIFIVIALDETRILVAVLFSVQNIYESCDLGCALWRSNVDVHQ